MTRSCGECVACCTYLTIEAPELSKPGMHHCKHQSLPGPEETNLLYYTGGNGCENCGVYGTLERPAVCAGYKCGWLVGLGNDEDRPDRSLILIDVDSERHIGNALEAKPLADGQQDTDAGRATIRRMSRDANKPAIVLNFRERCIVRIEGRGV